MPSCPVLARIYFNVENLVLWDRFLRLCKKLCFEK